MWEKKRPNKLWWSQAMKNARKNRRQTVWIHFVWILRTVEMQWKSTHMNVDVHVVISVSHFLHPLSSRSTLLSTFKLHLKLIERLTVMRCGSQFTLKLSTHIHTHTRVLIQTRCHTVWYIPFVCFYSSFVFFPLWFSVFLFHSEITAFISSHVLNVKFLIRLYSSTSPYVSWFVLSCCVHFYGGSEKCSLIIQFYYVEWMAIRHGFSAIWLGFIFIKSRSFSS